MKKIFITVIVIVATITISVSQNIPQVVSKAFEQKFPNAAKIKWDKENSHEYEAEFELNNSKYSSNFSDSGEWLETESPISFSQLPIEVQNSFNNIHKSEAIKAVSKIETSKGIEKFEVEIKNGIKTKELFYLIDGSEVKE